MKLRELAVGVGMMALALSLSAAATTSDKGISDQGIARIQKQVRHELNMLPYVNAFDYMTFSVDENGTVTLNGQVTRPVLKSDAANAVKRIEGVERVDNKIQVLPVSIFDNQLRLRLYRTIYAGPLARYALGTIQPIRIIVENGHVTLLGVVDSEFDKNVAGMRANTVPGIFSVENQLKVVSPRA
jgi:osmotically-inducible protein OsmY